MSYLHLPLSLSRLHPRSGDCAEGRRLQKKHGTSYYAATALFPKRLREATWTLYGFVRIPDEIVDGCPDTPEGRADAHRRLDAFRVAWDRAYHSGDSPDATLRATAALFHHYRVPWDCSTAFLSAMEQDLSVTRYESYAALEGYMYGSAAVVGVMMSHLIGFSDPSALPHARNLGYAMQLTNFLRDIDEDYALRGRIYLPQDELSRFGVREEQIARREFNDSFRALMTFQIERARALYADAACGIPLLAPEGRRAVRVAAALYSGILMRLEAQGKNPFAGRARTSRGEKLRLTMGAWF